jgi:hypothetical protein
VGKLTALNNTQEYLLLTDADVLTGARQNRIINKSVLLAPHSKTIINVSCIERLRWHYTERNFSNPQAVADPGMRREKASTMSERKQIHDERFRGTQGIVWERVHEMMSMENFDNKTESYSDLLQFRMEKKGKKFPKCEPEAECSGLAVLIDGKVTCIDLFGNEEVYRYYFPLLRDSAFRTANMEGKVRPLDINEAFFKSLDTLDNYENVPGHPDNEYIGAGSLNIVENDELIGFGLISNEEMIHTVLFIK